MKNFLKWEFIKIEEKLNKFKTAKKFLIVPDSSNVELEPENAEVIDVNDILKFCKKEEFNLLEKLH